jgi:hypothetical protein
MALQHTPNEELISLISLPVQGGMIITEPATQSSNWRKSTSSLGRLDDLPLELLHGTLALLDFRALSHISRTCIRGIEVVSSLPEYRDLMLHAPEALAALGKTRLIRYQPAANIHLALLSADCTSCGRYGAFLFLPTCERCCYHCLWKNQSLWVISMSMAKQCFGFSAAGAKTLPVMRAIAGNYNVKHTISRRRPIQLVCVGAAKKLAIAENTLLSTRQAQRHQYSTPRSQTKLSMLRFWQGARLAPPGPQLFMKPTVNFEPNDMYCGMASLQFPYLVPGNPVEHGLLCRGCMLFRLWWVRGDPTPAHLSHLALQGRRADDLVDEYQEVARSRAELLAHVKDCPGVQRMLQEAKAP